MKQSIYFIFLFFVFNSTVYAQWVREDFEFKRVQNLVPRLRQDTSIANRDWQIGWTSKEVVKTDSVHKRGLCTDTIHPVNPGDTFSLIALFRTGKSNNCWFDASFVYKLDADSTDKALFELSVDQGKSWIDLLANDTLYDIEWGTGKPVLNGNVPEWSIYFANMFSWVNDVQFQKYPVKLNGVDSILFRLTFIAGNSTRKRDGWLIDNLEFSKCFESIDELSSAIFFTLYPNPASESLSIRSTNDASIRQWQIFNLYGEKMSEGDGTNAQTIDVNHLSNGLYIARILSEGQWYSLKFEITTP